MEEHVEDELPGLRAASRSVVPSVPTRTVLDDHVAGPTTFMVMASGQLMPYSALDAQGRSFDWEDAVRLAYRRALLFMRDPVLRFVVVVRHGANEYQ